MGYLFGFLGYLVVVTIFNCLLQKYFSWRGKLPKPKKFAGRKSPVYKLVKNNFGYYYQIEKWELRYVEMIGDQWFIYFIPFIGLFQVYRYDLIDSLGQFKSDSFGKMKTLMLEYEILATAIEIEQEEKMTLKQRRQSKIDNLNGDFNNNYIK